METIYNAINKHKCCNIVILDHEKIAIVGCGPRDLHSLECLMDSLSRKRTKQQIGSPIIKNLLQVNLLEPMTCDLGVATDKAATYKIGS